MIEKLECYSGSEDGIHWYDHPTKREIIDKINEVINIINEMEPVQYGEWQYYKCLGEEDLYKCTNCDKPTSFKRGIRPYRIYERCPHCGAKIDGDK